jgi:hypothetical protein
MIMDKRWAATRAAAMNLDAFLERSVRELAQNGNDRAFAPGAPRVTGIVHSGPVQLASAVFDTTASLWPKERIPASSGARITHKCAGDEA